VSCGGHMPCHNDTSSGRLHRHSGGSRGSPHGSGGRLRRRGPALTDWFLAREWETRWRPSRRRTRLDGSPQPPCPLLAPPRPAEERPPGALGSGSRWILDCRKRLRSSSSDSSARSASWERAILQGPSEAPAGAKRTSIRWMIRRGSTPLVDRPATDNTHSRPLMGSRKVLGCGPAPLPTSDEPSITTRAGVGRGPESLVVESSPCPSWEGLGSFLVFSLMLEV
jgi:hypothetical protein